MIHKAEKKVNGNQTLHWEIAGQVGKAGGEGREMEGRTHLIAGVFNKNKIYNLCKLQMKTSGKRKI